MDQQQPEEQQQETHQQSNDQLKAYQRKWDEELEGFRKLVAKLQGQASASAQQQGSRAGAKLPAADLQAATGRGPISDSSCSEQLATALQQAEALLQEVHASAMQSLLSGAATDKLVAKQLRLQRNQGFEKAKALLLKAEGSLG